MHGSIRVRQPTFGASAEDVTPARMPRPLRVVLITTFYPPYSFGGDAVHVQLLAHALTDAGHRVDVVHCVDSFRTLRGRQPDDGVELRPGLTVHSLRSGFGALSPLLSQQTGAPHLKARVLQKIIAECEPDVIHFHNVSLFGPEVMSLAGAPRSALKLYTTHEYWLVCPTHQLWKYEAQPCETRDCLRCTLHARRPPQLWRYTDMLERCAREIDVFLAPSLFAATMHARHGFSRSMVHFPLFTTTPPSATTICVPSPHPRPYCLFAGRLEPAKNVGSLIDAWPRMPDVDLLIAGTGSEETRLRARAASDPRIRFLGQLRSDELNAYYTHCVACLVPSAWYEVFPMVVLEAFAHGAPVVAHDIGALAEMVEESGGGVLYRTEDEMVAAVAKLVASPALRSALGASGRRAVQGAWSADAYLARYHALLRATARRRFGDVPWDASVPSQQFLPTGHNGVRPELAHATEARDA